MVSLTILALVSGGFAYGLSLAMSVTREDRARIQAANLAARELESLRNEFSSSKSAPLTLAANSEVVNPHPLGEGVSGEPLILDGRAFTVVRTVEWLPAGTGTSPCDGGTAVTYPSLGANVRVSWSEAGQTRDVESNTVLTPPKGTLASIEGFVAAKVTGADGQGVAALPVDLSGPGGSQTRVTAADGCAVFAVTTPGSYDVTLDEDGYISFDGQRVVAKSASVTEGSIQVLPFSYDKAATLELVLSIEGDVGANFGLPSPPPAVTLFNASLPNMGTLVVDSGRTTVADLWPYPDGYSLWTGVCASNDPAATGGIRSEPIAPDPGETETARALLAPLEVTFTDLDDNPIEGLVVNATRYVPENAPVESSACEAQAFTLGDTNEQGIVRSSLPYGQWTISAGGQSFFADMPADGSVTYPLQLPASGGDE